MLRPFIMRHRLLIDVQINKLLKLFTCFSSNAKPNLDLRQSISSAVGAHSYSHKYRLHTQTNHGQNVDPIVL